MKTNLTELAAEIVKLMPDLMQDTANAETVVLAKLKPVFAELADAEKRLKEIAAEESACCPEMVGFREYIIHLEMEITRGRELIAAMGNEQ